MSNEAETRSQLNGHQWNPDVIVQEITRLREENRALREEARYSPVDPVSVGDKPDLLSLFLRRVVRDEGFTLKCKIGDISIELCPPAAWHEKVM